MRLAIFFLGLLASLSSQAAVVHGSDYANPPAQNAIRANSAGQVTTTLLSGEDSTNSVFKVEQQFSYKNIPHADTQVKATAGFVHTVTCGSDAAATAGTIILYDNPAETGTVVYTWTFTTNNYPSATVILDVAMPTGIYMGYTTTNDVDCVVSYR